MKNLAQVTVFQSKNNAKIVFEKNLDGFCIEIDLKLTSNKNTKRLTNQEV